MAAEPDRRPPRRGGDRAPRAERRPWAWCGLALAALWLPLLLWPLSWPYGWVYGGPAVRGAASAEWLPAWSDPREVALLLPEDQQGLFPNDAALLRPEPGHEDDCAVVPAGDLWFQPTGAVLAAASTAHRGNDCRLRLHVALDSVDGHQPVLALGGRRWGWAAWRSALDRAPALRGLAWWLAAARTALLGAAAAGLLAWTCCSGPRPRAALALLRAAVAAEAGAQLWLALAWAVALLDQWAPRDTPPRNRTAAQVVGWTGVALSAALAAGLLAVARGRGPWALRLLAGWGALLSPLSSFGGALGAAFLATWDELADRDL